MEGEEVEGGAAEANERGSEIVARLLVYYKVYTRVRCCVATEWNGDLLSRVRNLNLFKFRP